MAARPAEIGPVALRSRPTTGSMVYQASQDGVAFVDYQVGMIVRSFELAPL